MKAKNEIEVYSDRQGNWRWSLRNKNNNQILADSGEGYASPGNVRRAARKAGFALLFSSFRNVIRIAQQGDYRA